MIEILNLPYKIIKHYRILGFQGSLLLFKRYIKRFKSFNIKLTNYKYSVILRNNTTDISVFYQVFLERSYQFNIKAEPRVIIDCGANIGLSTVFFKHRYPKAKVIAIEPEISNFKMLELNTKMYNNVHCLNYGIWNKSTNLIIKDNNLGNWGFMVEEVDYKNETTIPAISIDEIIEKFNIKQIDILKNDIEGSEKELFQENFKTWLSKTKLLIIELHDGLNNGSSKSFFSAISNYEFSMIRKNENLVFFFN